MTMTMTTTTNPLHFYEVRVTHKATPWQPYAWQQNILVAAYIPKAAEVYVRGILPGFYDDYAVTVTARGDAPDWVTPGIQTRTPDNPPRHHYPAPAITKVDGQATRTCIVCGKPLRGQQRTYCTLHAGRQRPTATLEGANKFARKLTRADAVAIKLLLVNGEPITEIATRYGVSYSTIWLIARNQTWRGVAWPGEYPGEMAG